MKGRSEVREYEIRFRWMAKKERKIDRKRKRKIKH
jgi:hypothetical protein